MLYTIGHSNHSFEAFLALLKAYSVELLVDVRRFPASRRWPHFNGEPLANALREWAIDYTWMEALGGRRRSTNKDSPHTAWTVDAFRHYADYMETAPFLRALDSLMEQTETRRTAIMCAEARYWQCHRRLIADALLVRGWRISHIQSATRAIDHTLPDFARLQDGHIIYDRGTQLSLA